MHYYLPVSRCVTLYSILRVWDKVSCKIQVAHYVVVLVDKPTFLDTEDYPPCCHGDCFASHYIVQMYFCCV